MVMGIDSVTATQMPQILRALPRPAPSAPMLSGGAISPLRKLIGTGEASPSYFSVNRQRNEIRFVFDPETNRMVMQIVDLASGEVVRHIPPEVSQVLGKWFQQDGALFSALA